MNEHFDDYRDWPAPTIRQVPASAPAPRDDTPTYIKFLAGFFVACASVSLVIMALALYHFVTTT